MKKLPTSLALAAAVAALVLAVPFTATGAELDVLKAIAKDENRISKDVALDRNIDAPAAYKMMTSQKAAMVDVRTPQEYQFVGHVPGAYNIPLLVWGKWDDKKKSFGTDPNPDFVKQFSSVFKDKNAPIIVMCRSGHRSGKAVKALAAAGYTNLWHMWEGFEGLAVSDKDHPSYGKKIVDGWRNKGLPYTWDMDPALVVVK